MSKFLQIDGSLGEGGGQVLRISLCLSALYGIPIEITKIRAGRPKPGLAAQHLKGVELVAEMCNAELTGAYVGSTQLSFKPGILKNKKQVYTADIKTAGCISLLIQVALPCALFSSSPVTLILKGGTNAPMGPQIEYITEVFKPILNQFGADFTFTVIRRGYFPEGGGEVHLRVAPIHCLRPITLKDPGNPVDVKGWAFVAGSINFGEAQRMTNDSKTTITQELIKRDATIPRFDILTYKEERNMVIGNGAGINLVCETSTGCIYGGSGLLEKRRPHVPPGIEAANQILKPIINRACVDEHMQDQIILLMALAKGHSIVNIGSKELTCHSNTAKQIIEIMLGTKELNYSITGSGENADNPPFFLECQGCGLVNEIFTSE